MSRIAFALLVGLVFLGACTPKVPVTEVEVTPVVQPAAEASPDTLVYDFMEEQEPAVEEALLPEADLPPLEEPAIEEVAEPEVEPEVPTVTQEILPEESTPAFWVQVFASSTRERAEQFALDLDGKVTDVVRILHVEPHYKVLVGGFPLREDAMKLRQELVQKGYSDAWIFER